MAVAELTWLVILVLEIIVQEYIMSQHLSFRHDMIYCINHWNEFPITRDIFKPHEVYAKLSQRLNIMTLEVAMYLTRMYFCAND